MDIAPSQEEKLSNTNTDSLHLNNPSFQLSQNHYFTECNSIDKNMESISRQLGSYNTTPSIDSCLLIHKDEGVNESSPCPQPRLQPNSGLNENEKVNTDQNLNSEQGSKRKRNQYHNSQRAKKAGRAKVIRPINNFWTEVTELKNSQRALRTEISRLRQQQEDMVQMLRHLQLTQNLNHMFNSNPSATDKKTTLGPSIPLPLWYYPTPHLNFPQMPTGFDTEVPMRIHDQDHEVVEGAAGGDRLQLSSSQMWSGLDGGVHKNDQHPCHAATRDDTEGYDQVPAGNTQTHVTRAGEMLQMGVAQQTENGEMERETLAQRANGWLDFDERFRAAKVDGTFAKWLEDHIFTETTSNDLGS